MNYSCDFFTITIPDAEFLVCYQLISPTIRLKEFQEFVDYLLFPLSSTITNWGNLTEGEKSTIVDLILDGDWDGLKDELESLFPEEDPSNLEQYVQAFLYGYYSAAVAQAQSLAIDITLSEYAILPEGMKIPYKATLNAIDYDLYTLEESYTLERVEHRTQELNPFVYEVYLELVYHQDNYDRQTWQEAKSAANTAKIYKGGVITRFYTTHNGVDSTVYVLSFDMAYQETIGSRTFNYLPPETANYVHYVNAKFLMATDPNTRGGIYDAYLSGSSWERITSYPDTMGNPWPGDEDEKPFPESRYDWENINLNPPGVEYERALFDVELACVLMWIGTGEAPEPVTAPGGRSPFTSGFPPGFGIPGLPPGIPIPSIRREDE